MTTTIASLVADNLDLWTSATTRKRGAGRGSSKRISLYGIERLRALILDLAVRGKLVPQDAGDEPAGELLKRIKAEKTKLVASGKVKSGKPLSLPEDWPFGIPTNWVWSQLGVVTNYGQTDKADPGSVPPETWVLELEDVEKGTSRLLERVFCSDRQFQSQKNKFQLGDVIYGKLRPYLDKVIIADQAGVCTTEMVPMRGYGELRSDYIRLFLKTPYFISLATEAAHGMNLPRLATEKAREAPFPLPPLAEQRRIVAKVDELMAHCDALERESAGAMAAHQALVEALLATLVSSADAAELATNWARLESHFDTLFTTQASIDALKQTILDLAVRGKLVEQDAGDESASNLFDRMAKARTRLGIRSKPNLSSHRSDPAFNPILPDSWLSIPITEAYFSVPVGNNKILSSTILETGTYPVVDQGLRYIAGYTDDKELLIEIPGPVVVFGDHTKQVKYIDFNFVAGADGIKILRPLLIDELFFYLQLRGLRIEARGYARHFKQLNLMYFALPPLAEQQRIVAKVDALMAHCDALKARIIDAATTQKHLADAITERAAA